jgi:hypothetical protein
MNLVTEHIILEEDATLKEGLFRRYGGGRAYLTPTTITWVSTLPLLIRALSYFAPRYLHIDLRAIKKVTLTKELASSALRVTTDKQSYVIRPGPNSLFMRTDNASSADAWLEAIEEARRRVPRTP